MEGPYKKSSYTDMNCVQVAMLPGGDVAVRDSKDEAKAPHVYTRDEWIAFVAGVKDGEFDYPLPTPASPQLERVH